MRRRPDLGHGVDGDGRLGDDDPGLRGTAVVLLDQVDDVALQVGRPRQRRIGVDGEVVVAEIVDGHPVATTEDEDQLLHVWLPHDGAAPGGAPSRRFRSASSSSASCTWAA